MIASAGSDETAEMDGPDRDEYEKIRRRVLWQIPTGLFVVGSSAGGRRNLMTANLVMQISLQPKVIGVAVETEALTHRLITESKIFSVCILDREDRAVVRKFVKPVEDQDATSLAGFAVHAVTTGAPVLDIATGYLDCAVIHQLALGSHTLFAGEVVAAGFQGRGEGAKPLRMEDTRMHYGG